MGKGFDSKRLRMCDNEKKIVPNIEEKHQELQKHTCLFNLNGYNQRFINKWSFAGQTVLEHSYYDLIHQIGHR